MLERMAVFPRDLILNLRFFFPHRAPLETSAILNREVVYEPEDMSRKPLKLSVDWLNNQLYILFEIDLNVSEVENCVVSLSHHHIRFRRCGIRCVN